VGERLLGQEGSLERVIAQLRQDLPPDSVAGKVWQAWNNKES